MFKQLRCSAVDSKKLKNLKIAFFSCVAISVFAQMYQHFNASNWQFTAVVQKVIAVMLRLHSRFKSGDSNRGLMCPQWYISNFQGVDYV